MKKYLLEGVCYLISLWCIAFLILWPFDNGGNNKIARWQQLTRYIAGMPISSSHTWLPLIPSSCSWLAPLQPAQWIPCKKTINTQEVVQPSVGQKISESLRLSLERFEKSCAHTQIDYRALLFEDTLRNPTNEVSRTMQTYCIFQSFQHSWQPYWEVTSSLGDTVKTIAKIVSLDEWVSFDEQSRYEGQLPYPDMTPNAWYTPYVIFADAKWYLDGVVWSKFFGRGKLKAFSPLTKKQFAQLLKNLKKDPSAYDLFSQPGKYVTKQAMATVLADAFADELSDYSALYGNNIVFYRRLLARLENQKNQEAYLLSFLTNLKKRDADLMWWKYNIDVQGMIRFLEKILLEEPSL